MESMKMETCHMAEHYRERYLKPMLDLEAWRTHYSASPSLG